MIGLIRDIIRQIKLLFFRYEIIGAPIHTFDTTEKIIYHTITLVGLYYLIMYLYTFFRLVIGAIIASSIES
jgi:hypothetical protein